MLSVARDHASTRFENKILVVEEKGGCQPKTCHGGKIDGAQGTDSMCTSNCIIQPPTVQRSRDAEKLTGSLRDSVDRLY